jgi:dolichol-phosphate mannosyltransferase
LDNPQLAWRNFPLGHAVPRDQNQPVKVSISPSMSTLSKPRDSGPPAHHLESASGGSNAWNTSSRRTTHVRVVLPAFNEAESLGRLIPRIYEALSETAWSFDILVVDDGSSDDTYEIAQELQGTYPVQVVPHGVNRGLGAAITTCLTRGIEGLQNDDIVVAMDADNTHPPQLITRMVPMIREGHDVVIASRYQPGARVVGLALHREWLSLGARFMMKTLLPVRGCRDYTCGYRAYRVGLLRDAIQKQDGQLVHEAGFACMADLLLMLAGMGAVVGEVPLLLRYDFKRGASKMRIVRTVRQTLNMMLRHRLGVSAPSRRRPK